MFEVRRSIKISNKMESIMKKKKSPGLHQILVFAGKQLTDKRTLLECNVRHGSTLHLTMRQQGGEEDDDWKTGLREKRFWKAQLTRSRNRALSKLLETDHRVALQEAYEEEYAKALEKFSE